MKLAMKRYEAFFLALRLSPGALVGSAIWHLHPVSVRQGGADYRGKSARRACIREWPALRFKPPTVS